MDRCMFTAMICFGFTLSASSTVVPTSSSDQQQGITMWTDTTGVYEYHSEYSKILDKEGSHYDTNDTKFHVVETIITFDDIIRMTGKSPPRVYIHWSANNSHTRTVKGLCGFPPYYDREKCLQLEYENGSLGECKMKGGTAVYTFAISLLGICIVCANLLLPTVVLKDDSMRTHYHYIKVSLAFADILQGLLLLTAVLPNIGKFENMSEKEVVDYVAQDTNSPVAIIVGSLLTLSTQSSLLHLMFLSIERFIAVQWPFRHLRRKSRTVTIALVAIWMISTICCFTPAAFPDYFMYQFQTVQMIHMVTSSSTAESDASNLAEIVYGIVVIVLPYVITVVFSVLTGIISCAKIKSRAYKFGSEVCRVENTKSGGGYHHCINDSQRKKSTRNQIKPELAVFLTIVLMITAFTVTLLPFAIVVAFFATGVLQCSNYTYPYLIASYAAMSNSFANAIIYTIRDGRFRTAVKRLFHFNKKPGSVVQ